MYYTHDHPVFGLWRNPNTVKRHFTKSFDVLYESNSYGARDMERDRKSDQPRVIVLGDSFTEGHGLHPEDRITNLLEDRSRIPDLNFGIADSGTTEQLLVYRHLARDFDHAYVMLNFCSFNDFLDNDYIEGVKRSPERVRPFFVGEYPDYELVYYPESKVRELGALARELGFTYINILSDLHEAGGYLEKHYHAYDIHWNAEGNELVADILLRRLPYMSQVTSLP